MKHLLLIVLFLALAGCGSGDSNSNSVNSDNAADLEDATFGEDGELALYSVINGQLAISKQAQATSAQHRELVNDEEAHNAIWDLYTTVFGDHSLVEHLNYLLIFSDGPGGIMASVGPVDEDSGKMELGIDMVDSYEDGEYVEKELLIETLIHEYAHILASTIEQADYSVDEESCSTLFDNEGCLKADSYLYAFSENFWVGQLLADWDAIPIEEYDEQILDFASKYESHFVTEYAASNRQEDFAETWAWFILQDKPTDNDTVAKQKVLFLYEYNELVQIRQHIRSNIAAM